jgi:hypothetical protein
MAVVNHKSSHWAGGIDNGMKPIADVGAKSNN